MLTIDFETYYDKDYSLTKLTTEQYIRSPLFEVIGVGVKQDQEPAVWFSGNTVQTIDFLRELDIPNQQVLAHNAAFDAAILNWRFDLRPRVLLDTLSMARPITGLTVGGSLKALAQKFCLGEKGDEVRNALGKRRHDFTPEELAQYGEYCKNDVDLTYVLFHVLRQFSTPQEMFIIDMMLRMFTEPVLELDKATLQSHLAKVKAKKAKLLATLGGLGVAELMSNDKFAELLRQQGVEPPTKNSPAALKRGEIKPVFAFAKTDPEMKALAGHPNDAVQALAAARLGVKSTLEETRTEAFIGISGRGPLPIMLNYYGAHCVPGDTEVLTRSGWERLDAWSGGEIAQYEPASGHIEFLSATRFAGPVVDEWVSVEAPYVRCPMTFGHTVPYLTHRNLRPATKKAEHLLSCATTNVPLAGQYLAGGDITPEQMRVLVMVQADGHWQLDSRWGRELRIAVTKPRKIARARQLLTAAGVTFKEAQFPAHPGEVRFSVKYASWPSWLTPARKQFGPWLLDSTLGARLALLDEVWRWDGWEQNGQRCYASTVKANVEWVATLAHLTNYCAAFSERPAAGKRGVCFALRFRKRNHGMIKRAHVSAVFAPQQAFCTETKTGFWLARRLGHIFITGNTGRASGGDKINLQNLPRGGALRQAIMAPPGHVVVAGDSSQIEARKVAWLAGQDDLIRDFANREDIYSKFASDIYGRPIDRKRKELKAGKEVYPDFVEGFVGKTCIAEGQLVLTSRGPVPIEDVTLEDRLWDGQEWIHHDGVIYQGEKEVITWDGLTATADHEVFTEDGRIVPLGQAASEMVRLVRTGVSGQAIRFVDSHIAADTPRKELSLSTGYLQRQRCNEVDEPRQPNGRTDTRKVRVYDIANAGPLHRYTVADCLVLNCILGLGYGMGPDKFQLTLRNGQVPVEMDLAECQRIVDLYRGKYSEIRKLWKAADKALMSMVRGYEATFGVGISLRCTPEGIVLPNSMLVRYPGLHLRDNKVAYTSRKQVTFIYGAKIVENVVQALARIVVFNQMAKLEQHFRAIRDGQLRRVVLTVHDEIVAVVPEAEAETTKALMETIMSTPPKWATGLPVACEVGYGLTYGDCK